MNIKHLVRLHVAMLFLAAFKEFEGQTVSALLACDITQRAHDVTEELRNFAANLGYDEAMDDDIEPAEVRDMLNAYRRKPSDGLGDLARELSGAQA